MVTRPQSLGALATGFAPSLDVDPNEVLYCCPSGDGAQSILLIYKAQTGIRVVKCHSYMVMKLCTILPAWRKIYLLLRAN